MVMPKMGGAANNDDQQQRSEPIRAPLPLQMHGDDSGVVARRR
jgi:hypothetical protein